MERTSAAPDAFDRALDQIKGIPDVTMTKASTIRTMKTLAVGGSQLYVVQTARAVDDGRSQDTIFLEVYGSDGQHRLVLPHAVADAIARQRESLTSRTRSKAAKRQAAERAARGETPAFLKTRKKAPRR